MGEGRTWHWGKWEGVASSKQMGGLGIINLVKHVVALCAKIFVTLANSCHVWAIMARDMVEGNKIYCTRGKWKGMSVENKLLRPKGTRLKLGGHTWNIIAKCMEVAKFLTIRKRMGSKRASLFAMGLKRC